MTMTDPIADMLTRIRNGSLARKDAVEMPASRLKQQIASILQREGFVTGHRVEGDGAKKTLTIDLKYGETREPAVSGIRRISTPGRRVYRGRDDVPRVQGGLGVAILSTSQGLLTDRQARKAGVGGEVVAYVW